MVTKKSRLFDAANAKSPEYTYTENGALTLASSGSKVLDWFSRGGAMRNSSEAEIEKVFEQAYKENKVLAVAILFYLRDVRGGQGERRVFQIAFTWLTKKNPSLAALLLPLIPEYGYWKDILSFRKTTDVKVRDLYMQGLNYMGKQLLSDAVKLRDEGDKASISLAAKWSPSEKAGKYTKQIAYDLIRVMGITPRQYRLLNSNLRQHLNIVERYMCSKDFDQIRYESVPSRAAMLYRKAFTRNDRTRYSQYLDDVKAGKKEIKASTLYPYDIVAKLRKHTAKGTDETLELQWKALPDYPTKGLAVIDTSGSMGWSPVTGDVYPIDVALSLGIYMAERNTSIFKDKFITFSNNPSFVELKGATLKQRIANAREAEWDGSTNIQAVFDMILKLAVENDLPEEEMPDIIYIFSDMEFNPASSHGIVRGLTNLQTITAKYKKAGYKRPKIVMWNVQSRNAQSPASFDENDTALFSGCSPSLFKIALEGELNPIKAMLAAVDVDRYHPIMELVAEHS